MTEGDNEKVSLKFWISALAFCMLLMASTFALLASYLAEIKSNTVAALARTDIVTQHLNTLDAEVSAIHRHILSEKSANANAAPASVAVEVPVETKPAPAAALPAIQAPALAEPAVTAPVAPAAATSAPTVVIPVAPAKP